ncbi:MAG: hypothetical protein ACR2M6_01745 [Vampirovibrionia bacterium]
MIKIRHSNCGFYSCCSVKLERIIKYINSIKRLPDNVDSSELFDLYKKNTNKDVTFDYFEHYENVPDVNIIHPIAFNWRDQYIDYSNLDYKCITPLIKKYFSPSSQINEIISNIEKKYDIAVAKTIAVYYRGTDKFKETQLSPFNDFYNQIIKIVNINKDINILLQSDSAQFIDYINSKNLKNVVIIDENKTSYSDKGIHNEQSHSTNYLDMLYFLSTIVIISKCKYIVCSSGNCSLWTMFYRGNNENVIQYVEGTWYNSVF